MPFKALQSLAVRCKQMRIGRVKTQLGRFVCTCLAAPACLRNNQSGCAFILYIEISLTAKAFYNHDLSLENTIRGRVKMFRTNAENQGRTRVYSYAFDGRFDRTAIGELDCDPIGIDYAGVDFDEVHGR